MRQQICAHQFIELMLIYLIDFFFQLLAAHSEHFRSIFFKQNTDNVIALPGPQHLTPKNVLSKDGFDIFYAFISAGSRRIGAMIAGNKVRGIVKN